MLSEAVRRFEANRRRWQELLPIAPSSPELGTWLRRRKVSGVWGVGCLSCRLAQERNAFGLFQIRAESSMELRKFQRHAASLQHKRGVHLLLGDKSVEFTKSVPSTDDFQLILRDIRSGKSYSQGIFERKKVEKMAWCLSEAVLDRDRRVLGTAESIAVHQDVCAPRLLIRFSACSSDFRVHKGVLGMARDFGTTATNLKNATKDVLQQFCTPRVAAPRAPQNSHVAVDRALLNYLSSKVHLFDADGAADEQRAGRILSTVCCGEAAVFPHIQLLLRDKAHASRRLTSRPWLADPFFANLLEKYVQKKGSILHTIQHSPDISQTFSQHCASIVGCPILGPRIKSLRYCQHRFDSTSQPLGRFVLYFDAVWATASDLLSTRRGREPAKVAEVFLSGVCPEDIFQLALLADAGHECLAVTRFHDRESYDVAEISHVIADLVHKLDILFVKQGARGCPTYPRLPQSLTLHCLT